MTMTSNPKTSAGVFDSVAPDAGPGGDTGVVRSSSSGDVTPITVCVGAAAAVASKGDGRKPPERSADDDERIALHEIGGHALVGRLLGQPIGGVSCESADSDGHSGLCWGPEFRRSRFDGGGVDDTEAFSEKLRPLMPALGESRADAADIFLHVHTRIVELVAGSVAEAMFLPGEPWYAVDDRRQELALASLITSSDESAQAFVDACMLEAAALLRPREHIARALTAELLERRTMTGKEIDAVIIEAVAAKAREDEKQRQLDWRRREESAAQFYASVAKAQTLPAESLRYAGYISQFTSIKQA
jgi:hypothetical protein